MTDIVWQDPPDPAWTAEAAQLMAHPKRWALLKTYPNLALPSAIKRSALRGGQVALLPVGAWEFRVSGCDLYARYVGEDTTEETR